MRSRLQWHYKANLDVVQRKCSVDISFTYSRNNEYRSWCVVKTIQWLYRMEIMTLYFPQSNRSTAEARHRFLCIMFKFSDETIHFLGTWPRSFSHKCLYSKLVKMANLCLSAFQLAAGSPYQVAERQGRRDPDCPKMADGGVVPPNVEDVDKRACSSSMRKAYYQSTSQGSCSSSTQEASTSGLHLIRKSLEARGVQGQTFQVIWASWWQSTRQQYASYLTRYNKCCIQHQCDPLHPPVDMVLQFLKLYEEGLGYSAVNTARSALSAAVICPDNKTVGSHPLVVWFLKGIF